MKNFLGVLLIILGVITGIYLGGWVMFIGGIIDVIQVVQVPPIIPGDLAIGIAKIFLCEFGFMLGWVIGIVGLYVITE